MIWRDWCRELGIKGVFIDPFCNTTAAHLGEKWIAPRPATDAAMAEAIAYVWIKEDTYDHWFVENRTVGFEEFKEHILGKEDGIDRTPQWAAAICDVPAHTIIALAREWAAKKTMLATGWHVRHRRRLPRRLRYGMGASHGPPHLHAGPGQSKA